MRLIDAEGSELQTQLKIIREAEYQIYGSGSWGFTAKCEHAIEDAPTVQPEPQIIRCKDCKHHWTHKCMDSMPIERCDLEQTFYDAEVDYCSLAERKDVTE